MKRDAPKALTLPSPHSHLCESPTLPPIPPPPPSDLYLLKDFLLQTSHAPSLSPSLRSPPSEQLPHRGFQYLLTSKTEATAARGEGNEAGAGKP